MERNFLLFDSAEEAQAKLVQLGLRAIVARMDFTYSDGSTATKWVVNRIIMGEKRDASDMRVEWLCEDDIWRE